MPTIEQVIADLKAQYAFHSVILYGSRAGDDFRPDSDYDLLCIREAGPRVREVLKLHGFNIDLIVEDESISERPYDTMYVWQSQILMDEKGFAQGLINANQELLSHPPERMPKNRRQQRKKQLFDALPYLKQDGTLAHYRQHDLLMKLLPLYFDFKGQWFLGDKHALKYIKQHDLIAYTMFQQALRPEASYAQIERLTLFVASLAD